MMALSGVPIFFSGFWSKDEILHAAHGWRGSAAHLPFYLGIFGALLTAFYMTRQMFYVFAGDCRLSLGRPTVSEKVTLEHGGAPIKASPAVEVHDRPHESPGIMITPLVILAVCSVVLGFVGTPAWPWFQSFLEGERATVDYARFNQPEVILVMVSSIVVVIAGMVSVGGSMERRPLASREDVLERAQPEIYTMLRRKYFIDEAYEWAVVGFNRWFARTCDWLDRTIWNGAVWAIAYIVLALSAASRIFDEKVVNSGFDAGCEGVSHGGGLLSRLQDGRVQDYLRVIGVALTVLVLLLIWGCGGLMNRLPILTILTLLPLLGGVVVIGLGAEQRKLSRSLFAGIQSHHAGPDAGGLLELRFHSHSSPI